MSVTAENAEKTRRRVKEEPKSSSLAVKRLIKDDATDSDYSSESENGVSRPDKPIHFASESPFSSRSGPQNYRGLLNNCILLLVLSNSKNVITNLLKYGFLVNPLQWFEASVYYNNWPCYGLLLVMWLFPLTILRVEQAASKGKLSNRVVAVCYFLILATQLIFPVLVVLLTKMGLIGSVFCLSWYTIIWLKMMSYTQVNWWCRNSPTRKKDDDLDRKDKHLVRYPDNLNIRDLFYFCCAPTLCYELNFPRNERIRKIFLFRRVMEFVFILNVEIAIMQQWIIPTTLNSLQPFKDMELTLMVERVLLLAIPNHMFWLLGFYGFFHSMLNIIAELMRFADRQFYRDWWNSQTIRHFWKAWNVPVHRFAVRHVYSPLVKTHKLSKIAAQGIVFAGSAFFHEYLVSFPLRMLRHWAFLAMMGQVPLGILTDFRIFRGQVGNIIVWLSIILGQPVAILMYLHDFYWTHWAPLAQNATTTG